MATWVDLSEENLRAAKLLLDEGHWRSAVSRAYYAAYAALTGVFREMNVQFRFGDLNPSHDQLLALTAHNLDPKRFSGGRRRQLKRAATMLQASRLAADYDPRRTIDAGIARDMVRQAALIVSVTEEAA